MLSLVTGLGEDGDTADNIYDRILYNEIVMNLWKFEYLGEMPKIW